jgi:hypothetical protein
LHQTYPSCQVRENGNGFRIDGCHEHTYQQSYILAYSHSHILTFSHSFRFGCWFLFVLIVSLRCCIFFFANHNI